MSEDAHAAGARFSRIDSFGIVVGAYLVALVAALWTLAWCDPAHPFWSVAMADLVATLVIFAFSMKLDNGSMYDAYWSVAPPFFVAFWIGHASADASTLRQALMTALVLGWAIRLTWNWARAWPIRSVIRSISCGKCSCCSGIVSPAGWWASASDCGRCTSTTRNRPTMPSTG